jgi:hypothetical protein
MNRIYHHHSKWEEVDYGMYDPINIKEKNIMVQRVINFFRQKSLVEKYMAYVVDSFRYSCEHIFTNPNFNKIAWLGQASVSVWGNIPKDITIIAWNYLDKNTQEQANNIAKNEIERWLSFRKNI